MVQISLTIIIPDRRAALPNEVFFACACACGLVVDRHCAPACANSAAVAGSVAPGKDEAADVPLSPLARTAPPPGAVPTEESTARASAES